MSNLKSKIRNAVGVTKFLESEWHSKHVVDVLKYLAAGGKQTEAEIKDEVQEKVDKFKDLQKYSLVLYETVSKNIIESELFNKLSDIRKANSDHPHAAPEFDPVLFMKLVRIVKSEHPRFFPLRNFSDSKHLYNPRWILVPNDTEKRYNSIPTAAATATGEFIFCVPFMQDLLNFAAIKGLKPKSKKYESQGGSFPDGYAYIEFLILHELMHYTQADFHYGKVFKDVSPKILNYVGDYRSNYELVKGGYEQLPIGLYSDHINYDRQNTYKEMIDLVVTEMAKLPKDMQEKLQKHLDQQGDEHGEQGEPSEGDAEPKEGTEGDVDEAGKKSRESMNDKKDTGEEKESKEIKPGQSKSGGPGNGQKNTSTAFDPASIKPRHNWKELLAKAIKHSAEVEETYAKPNRRAITGVVLAQSRGAAAMKPGDIEFPLSVKLQIVVDSSGSMGHVLPTVYANIKQLLKLREIDPVFSLIRYSDSFDEWNCNTKNDKAVNAEDKTTDRTSKIFTTTFGGGTSFNDKLASVLVERASKGFTVIVFSDSDVLSGSNLTSLKKVIASKAYVIFDSAETFRQAAKILKSVSFNVSHL